MSDRSLTLSQRNIPMKKLYLFKVSAIQLNSCFLSMASVSIQLDIQRSTNLTTESLPLPLPLPMLKLVQYPSTCL